eukprot:s477_g24.t1
MALFRMLWIVVSSSSVSAENAQPCPKSYYCPGQTRQPVLCPVRHYCPEGRSEPLLCPPGHVCKGLGLEVFVDAAWGDVVPLAAGDLHTVVVSKSGQIWAAGYNQHGQLGTGGTVEQHAFVHVAVDGKKIMAVAAGGVHTAAITESGELWTWGNNWCGQVGVVLPMELHVPVKVSVNGQKIVAVAAGEVHTAAITDSGELWTWGPNKPGDVCIGGASVSGHVPVNVNVNDQPIVAVAAGRRHIVAITDSGELWTWGQNGDGQLGVGDTAHRHAPVKVSVNGQKIVAVAAGHLHTAAITDSGELWTWGYNGHGQLGVGDTQERHAPVKVSMNGQKIVAVAARGRHSAAITEAGDLWTWGRPAECPDVDSTTHYFPVKVSVPTGLKIVAVAIGLRHIAAITHSGELWTWGCNFQGELGVGDTANRHSPVKAALPAQIGEMPVPLCWSPEGLAPSALAEAFLATRASKVPVPRQCSALRSQLAAFQQRRVHVGDVGAWEATPCPAGSFCPREQVGPFSASLEDGAVQQCPAGTEGSAAPTACKAGVLCPAGSAGSSREPVPAGLTCGSDAQSGGSSTKTCHEAANLKMSCSELQEQQQAAKRSMDTMGPNLESRIAKLEQQLLETSVDSVSQPTEGGVFRGTEALSIWRGVMIVSALAAGSFLFRLRLPGSQQVTQYSQAGRRVLKIPCPGISIHDVRIRHSGLLVEVDLGQRATKSRLVQTRLHPSFFQAFEFRQDETVMEDGFLYLHFVEFAEQTYEFPVTEDLREDGIRAEEVRAPSESTENSFELVEARDGANE